MRLLSLPGWRCCFLAAVVLDRPKLLFVLPICVLLALLRGKASSSRIKKCNEPNCDEQQLRILELKDHKRVAPRVWLRLRRRLLACVLDDAHAPTHTTRQAHHTPPARPPTHPHRQYFVIYYYTCVYTTHATHTRHTHTTTHSQTQNHTQPHTTPHRHRRRHRGGWG